jgi:hypothetical protein
MARTPRPHRQPERNDPRDATTGDLSVLTRKGWIRSTVEGMWENPLRVAGPVGLPEALEIETGRAGLGNHPSLRAE